MGDDAGGDVRVRRRRPGFTLFAAGAAFEGALLAPDPQPRDRVRSLGWESLVAAVAVVLTVGLTQCAVWIAAALLVLLMFSSCALRSWSPRVASLALMGAITVYVTGAGYITVGRIGWFVLAVVEELHARVVDLALALDGHAVRSEDSLAGTPRSCRLPLRRG